MFPMPFSNPHTYAGHGGIDYPQPTGTPVRAIGDGIITYSGWWNQNAGNTRTVTLDGGGLQSINCHLVNLAGPRVGSRVRAGDVIGYVGSTGRSTGPHLHHELWLNGVKKAGADYWRYIDRGRVVGSGAGAGSGAGNEASKPSVPATGAGAAPKIEEDIMASIPPLVQQANSDAIWAIEGGKKHHVLPPELAVYEAHAKKRGLSINDFIVKGDDIPLSKIPNA